MHSVSCRLRERNIEAQSPAMLSHGLDHTAEMEIFQQKPACLGYGRMFGIEVRADGWLDVRVVRIGDTLC